MDKKSFLLEQISPLLEQLKADTIPAFGLMSSQHMIEHLTLIIKSSVKDYGQAEGEPTKGHLAFKKFIAAGALFKHFPKGKTKADLPPLKYASLAEAVAQLSVATARFYAFFEAKPDHLAYHPMLGTLSFEELELFHHEHCRFHFHQFGLLAAYP